jgi:hypothetical protein
MFIQIIILFVNLIKLLRYLAMKCLASYFLYTIAMINNYMTLDLLVRNMPEGPAIKCDLCNKVASRTQLANRYSNPNFRLMFFLSYMLVLIYLMTFLRKKYIFPIQ